MLFRVTSRRISYRCIQNPGRESSRGGGSGAAWPGLALSGILAKRLLSSTPSVGPIKPDIERLKSQPPKIIPDYLTPMPSHLLTTVLADLEACGSGADKPTVSSPTATLMPGETLSENRSRSSPLVQSPPATLPQGHHLVYFPIQTAPSHLAADGADMDHSPGSAFSRRLWAGGEVSFRGTDSRADRGRLAMDGQAWTCTETIGDVRCTGPPTGGKQGDEKVFVDVWRRYALGHTFSQDEELPWSIEERRTLVFVKPGEEASVSSASASPKIIKYPHEATHSVRILPSPQHLFHFSALTFNAHSIHIDPEYARSVDGHRAPLVHGPLTLALMLRALTGVSGRQVARIVYRNHAPLYVNEMLTVKVRPLSARDDGESASKWEAWVEGPDGGLAVKGTAAMASS